MDLPSRGFCCSSRILRGNKRKRRDGQIHRPCLRDEKKFWNCRDMGILIVVSALGTVPKGAERKLEETETKEEESRPFWLQHRCDRPEYSEESWRPEETGSHSHSRGRPLVKNLEGIMIIIMT